MSQCYENLQQPWNAESWLHKAAAETPNAREPWLSLAELYYKTGRWPDCFAAALRTLSITDRALVYTADPSAWGYKPHDLAAISAWRIGLNKVAVEQGNLAIECEPNDDRLKDNMKWYLGEKEKEKEKEEESAEDCDSPVEQNS
jgi:tetratricopeptide (TPR) repeat protein